MFQDFFAQLFQVLFTWLFIFLVIYLALSYAFSPRKKFGNIHSRWHHSFDFQFSTQDFYAEVEQAIRNKRIEWVRVDRVTYSSSKVPWAGSRLYLQVSRADQMFLICAAPFGEGFFVSWWMGEPMDFIKDLIPRIPKIGPAIAEWLYAKTFFQMDTDDMFKGAIKEAVDSVVEEISKEKGTRGLSDLDRVPIHIPLKERY